MNEGLEFHDSVVQVVELRAGCLCVEFCSAYIHRSLGRPGIDDGEGYVQPARLVLTEVNCSGDLAACAGQLSGGSLIVNGNAVELLPVPSSGNGKVQAELVFISGEVLNVEAGSFECYSFGEASYIERYVA